MEIITNFTKISFNYKVLIPIVYFVIPAVPSILLNIQCTYVCTNMTTVIINAHTPIYFLIRYAHGPCLFLMSVCFVVLEPCLYSKFHY